LRYHTPLVTHQVHVSAAYVGETLACCVDLGRAGGVGSLVNRERSRYDSDQAGTRMRVPPSVSPNWERVLGDIEVRISLRLQFQVPVEERSVDHGIDFIARQVEQAIREGSGLHNIGRVARVQKVDCCDSARGRCAGRHGRQHAERDQHGCDEEQSASQKQAVNWVCYMWSFHNFWF